MLWLGVDVGGTFTDLVLFDRAAGKLHVLKTPVDAAQPVGGHPSRDQSARRGGKEVRAHGARHHGGNQHGARARRRAARRPGDCRPQGRAGGRPRQPHGHVRHQGAAAASAGAAIAVLRGARKAARRRFGADAARRGRGGCDRRAARCRRRRGRGHLLPALLCQSRARAALRSAGLQEAPRSDRDDLGRGAPRIQGVRALLDHRAQRLRRAAHAPLSRRPAQQAGRGRHVGAAGDHDVERRLAPRRPGRGDAGAVDAVGTGSGRDRGRACRVRGRLSRSHHMRHGRHVDRRVPRARRHLRHDDGRPRRRLSDQDQADRHQFDRRRRRQHRRARQREAI